MKKNSSNEVATFAGGCFWCVEAAFLLIPGVEKVVSGYSGGEIKNPSYEQVSSGETGHREAIQITFNPKKISYENLLNHFWKNIDPSDNNGQFYDRGFQYSPAIFYHSDEQKKSALESRKKIETMKKFEKIAVEIIPFKNFYSAEDYHQNYAKKNPLQYKMYKIGSGRNSFLKKVWEKK
ncbi:peptide-methionine (S)-S-oxide reductase MsrA [Candidatus Pacearchaeota archaeon]|nr:peptide-methionine (S)-S-oxide reductase MsrA [Candidatus Pacearchaeota archaeon]